ncbi:DUF2079 domain-containing protein [Streptomyces millisiae]|uniref:DUF2079 domain-containing protein n=1 Tax=Streptomyces millisiae TaxID=3075542 RepID=A0ABU2LR35_9ACTN|nr:DUF2079 domain-containing protein [Streptomyces sp. DSM 44918]MDT0319513.1 DUF2079 domain-containing protein [Streptomyces sp. DSM 44918]
MTSTTHTPTRTPPRTVARPTPRWGSRLPSDGVLLAIGFFVVYATLSVTRHLRWENRSWDLGIFEQAISAYARLNEPVADLKGPGFPILGDHFSPITALLAPLYRVFPSPVTLLVAQAALFALAVVPVTRGAAFLLGRPAGAAIGAAFGLSWGMQRAVDFDFHEICFAVPLIAFSLEAVLRQRWRAALCWALPLLLVKEDLGLTVAVLALVVAWRAHQAGHVRATRAALAVAGLAVLACALVIGVVIPGFNAAGGYDYWAKVDEGGGPLDALFSSADTKLRTLLWILVPTTGLLALRSPLLLVVLPTLAWRFASQEPNYWGTDFHYSAVLMPVTALALADAVARSRDSSRPWLRSYARQLPAAALAAALALSTTLPVATLTHADTYRPGPVAEAGERVLAAVPDGADVAANVRPISHLTQRARVFWIGDPRIPAPEYVAYYDPARDAAGMLAYARQLYPDAAYRVTASEAGFWVLRRD